MSTKNTCVAFRLVPFTLRATGEHYIANIYIKDLDLLCHGTVKRDKHSGNLSIDTWWPIALVDERWISANLTLHIDVEEVYYSQKQYNTLEDIALGLIDCGDMPEFEIESAEKRQVYYDSIDIETLQKDGVVPTDDPQNPTIH